MDSGLGDTLETWSEVFPKVQEMTHVCAYDRAGLGRSDAGPTPRTSERIVQELHALLKKARIPAPYLLVGHSFGGLNIRLYASEFPKETAGLVLVEATHEDYPSLERTVRPPAEARKIENAFGMARPAAQSEYQSIPESVAQVRSAPPLPDVPVVVITAGRLGESAPLRDLWMKLQRDLISKIPHARQVLSSESGHYVQFDDPKLVVGAIRDVTEEARRRLAPTP